MCFTEAPGEDFELSYVESEFGDVNVSCEVVGIFPNPGMKLYLLSSASSRPQLVTNVKTAATARPNGAFDVQLQRTLDVKELLESKASVFECLVHLPGTNYVKTKRTAFFPGEKLNFILYCCACSVSQIHLLRFLLSNDYSMKGPKRFVKFTRIIH